MDKLKHVIAGLAVIEERAGNTEISRGLYKVLLESEDLNYQQIAFKIHNTYTEVMNDNWEKAKVYHA